MENLCDIKKKYQEFKRWILIVYKHPWHTLSDTTLLEALKEYNKEHKTSVKKFWS